MDVVNAYSEPGSLTESMALYQGNWNEWTARMRQLLERRDLRMGFPDYKHRQYWGEYSDEQKQAAAQLIRSQVDPSLLQRIPDNVRNDAPVLMQHLVAQVKPFKLLKLPPNIRANIYSHLLGDHTMLNDTVSMSLVHREFFPPDLMQVCSSIRQEFAPMFYHDLRVHIFRDSREEEEHIELSKMFLSWTRKIAGPWARRLRTLIIFDDIDEESYRTDIILDTNGNLHSDGLLELAEDGWVETDVLVDRSVDLVARCQEFYHALVGARPDTLLIMAGLSYLALSDPRTEADDEVFENAALTMAQYEESDSDEDAVDSEEEESD